MQHKGFRIISIILYGSLSLLCFFDATNALVPQPQVKVKAQRNINNNHHQPTNQIKETSASSLSRRDALLKYAFLLTPIITSTSVLQPTPPANALEACRPNAHNCIRTTWTAPSSVTSSSEAANTIRDVLNSYPQKGQAGVDCNGWKIVKDELGAEAGSSSSSNTIKLEYKSCVGPAALAINLGQPFIDDLKLELGKDDANGSITVEVKSSSRMGSGDLFVNRKRLIYLGGMLKEKGWDVPNPKYAYEN
mmetsp:Transcript_1883/g.3365  ORF Transcript_1883/g.3365 Transcript_1883/m.3365 type:complete len:249 (-) Transcript_1883:536-1282(-)